jgi:hypothetical protein
MTGNLLLSQNVRNFAFAKLRIGVVAPEQLGDFLCPSKYSGVVPLSREGSPDPGLSSKGRHHFIFGTPGRCLTAKNWING